MYSAILCLFLKGMVAKQPLPCIGEGLIASPWASFMKSTVICRLLKFERAGDQIGLIAYPTELVAQAGKA